MHIPTLDSLEVSLAYSIDEFFPKSRENRKLEISNIYTHAQIKTFAIRYNISVILPEKETNAAWRSIEKLPEPRFGVSEARAHERKIRPWLHQTELGCSHLSKPNESSPWCLEIPIKEFIVNLVFFL